MINPPFIYRESIPSDEFSDEYLRILRQGYCDVPPEAVLCYTDGVFRFDSMPYLKNIVIPTLVISGRWDIAFPPDQVELLHKGIPNSRYLKFETSGHLPFVTQKQLFNDSLKEFLSRL